MSCGFDIHPGFEHFSFGINEKTRTKHSGDDFPIIIFFSKCSEVLMQDHLWIWKKWIFESILFTKFSMTLRSITWNSQKWNTKFFKFSYQSRKILIFQSASWSVIFWVKIEKYVIFPRKNFSKWEVFYIIFWKKDIKFFL